MILYAVKPGEKPVRIEDAPGARELFGWISAMGYRAAWVMVDEGVCTEKPTACCYGSEGE